MNENVNKRKKHVIIFALVALIAIISGVLLCVFLFCGERIYSFDYINEDLSQYIEMKESDYKGYNLTIKLGEITDKTVEEHIMQTLYQYRSEEAKNPGKTVPLSAGDSVEIWYRGYIKNEEGKEEELRSFSNMTSTSPYKLGLGSAKLPLGVESSLLGVVIGNYSSLNDVKRDVGEKIESGDVLYISYSLLSAENGESFWSSVRVDLTRDDIDELFGAGFREQIIGKEIPENRVIGNFTTQAEKGKNVFRDVKILTAYPKNSNYITVQGILPYDYEDYSLAGEPIYFDIFPHYYTSYDLPTLDDNFIFETLKITKEELDGYEGENNVQKYKALVKDALTQEREEELFGIKEEAMWYHYNSVAKIKAYPEEAILATYSFKLKEIEMLYEEYADMYPNFDDFATMYLTLPEDADWKAILRENAKEEVKEKLIFYYIVKKEGFLPNESEYKAIHGEIFGDFVHYYMDEKTEENFDSKEAFKTAREKAEKEVLEYYGEDFFEHLVYYDFAIDSLVNLAKIDILN